MGIVSPYDGVQTPRNPAQQDALQAPSAFGFSNNLTDPLRNFKFLVTIYHKPAGYQDYFTQTIGFMSVSGIAATTESIPYREGGMNTTVHQLPGQTSFSPVTMQRGVTVNHRGPYDWFRQLFSVIGGQGNGPANHPSGNNFRAGVDIDILEHPVTDLENVGSDLATPVKLRIHLYNAWITNLSLSDLNAGDNAVLVEQMTLVHEGFGLSYGAPGYNSAVGLGNV